MVVAMDSNTQLTTDLQKSGLVPKDLNAYLAQEAELAAVGLRPHMYLDTPGVGSPGYVIPYYDIHGVRAPFYRVKLFKPLPKGARYLQPSNTGSWVYFPQSFKVLLEATLKGQSRSSINGFDPVIMICEGEKKAAKACSEGFLTVGLGGVYNWRSRVVVLPKGTSLTKNSQDEIIAKVSNGTISTSTSDKRAVLANGLTSVIDIAKREKMQVVIAFDTDPIVNPMVQRACAELAFELRTFGIPVDHLRQLIFPAEGQKVGLDDFIVDEGGKALDQLLHATLAARSAYPQHPDLKALINGRMDGLMSRSEAKELALLVLSDMDVNGQRMIERNTGTPYYFDGRSKRLMAVNLLHHHNEPLHESKFGEYLYDTYDVSQGDSKLLTWVAAGFTGEQPVHDVMPRSVLALLPPDKLALQTGDGHFAIVSAEGLEITDNGTEGVLFRSDQVEEVDTEKLCTEFTKQVKWLQLGTTNFEDMYWPKALKQFKFHKSSDWQVMSTLCYMSPWLLRWHGTQLPVELAVGEPGSGKSSLYSLRLQVLTGRPALRNQPTDIRDWYSSITAQDGLHVIDNLHFATKEIKQRLSDEICRIVTEPSPFIEMRRLFTTADVARMPVRNVFACTAIQQPFVNADILQRSVIFELSAVGTAHDSDWASLQLSRFGGRVGWLAHQLAVIHLFLRGTKTGWNPNFKSGHRLANFEQMFTHFGRILKMNNMPNVTTLLVNLAEDQVSEYDWTIEALKEFAMEHLPQLQKDPGRYVTCQDISVWALAHEDYMDNTIVTNARRLSRYMDSHAFMVEKCAGITNTNKKYANRIAYRLVPVKG